MMNKKGEILGEQHEGTIPTEKKLQNEKKENIVSERKEKSQQKETRKERKKHIHHWGIYDSCSRDTYLLKFDY